MKSPSSRSTAVLGLSVMVRDFWASEIKVKELIKDDKASLSSGVKVGGMLVPEYRVAPAELDR